MASLAVLVSGWLQAGELVWNRPDFLKRVRIIPGERTAFGAPSLSVLEEQVRRPLTPNERALYQRTDGGPWKAYEDDLLRFEVPDEPLLKIETVAPKEANKLSFVGGAVGTTDRHYERAYRLTVGENLPYGIILVSKADWFDEGICLCGPIALKKFQLCEGTLLEFSLLPDGAVKKVQALGARRRAVLFEWTHSAITQVAYARIGNSLRLKEPSPMTRSAWIATTAQRRKAEFLPCLGWLDSGFAEADVINLLGKPARRESSALVYAREERRDAGDGYRTTVRVPLTNGMFHKFGKDWFVAKELVPPRGSLAWALKLTNKTSSEERAKSTIAKADSDLMFDRFLSEAPKVSSIEWNQWCSVVYALSEKGIRDERVLPPVKRRFLESSVNQHYAAWVLHNYKAEGRDELFAKRLCMTLDARKKTNSETPSWDDPLDDASDLYSFLDAKHPEFAPLLRKGLYHPSEHIRGNALYRADRMPSPETREAARKALQTEKSEHSRKMAAYLIRDIGTAEDLLWLRESAQRESSKDVRKAIDEALKEIAERTAR
ncbi:MAG: HEAT repeat domain-containing protein [Verrucomicrobia bacterium]|nr:HEAT repeat domain-containing protein [Verrucomicrobiota bacterium]